MKNAPHRRGVVVTSWTEMDEEMARQGEATKRRMVSFGQPSRGGGGIQKDLLVPGKQRVLGQNRKSSGYGSQGS